jgi:hypothetical protein
MPLFARRDNPAPVTDIAMASNGNGHRRMHQVRSFTAAATIIESGNRTEAARIRKLKQPWQEEAWDYRDAIGELRYATTYLGNAARRMVLVPSAYVPGELNPIPLTDIDDCPKDVVLAAQDALNRLAIGGQVALGGMLRDITENFEVAGECYLIGKAAKTQTEGAPVEVETWEIRSVSEVNSDGDKITVKDVGDTGQGEPLGANSFCSRLWWPHPRRKSLADSPFKAILDVAEELLILSRDVRAAGRSRLANSGILLIPDTLTIIRANTVDDANDSESGDEFFDELMSAAMAAIQDEGSASAILPVVARGPADALDKVKQITISRPESQRASDRLELITRMATGLDLPAEVLTGKGDLNHWTAWQVSDDTFRHHIEPIIQVETDALTLGYYRPELLARKVDPVWVSKIVLWYDPTNLVTHPDRSSDAKDAWDRDVISDEALRDYMGFTEEDAPETKELLERMVRKAKSVDPTIAAQIIERWDPTIDAEEAKKPQQPPQINLVRPGPGEQPSPEAPAPSEGPEEEPPETPGGALPASAHPAPLTLLPGMTYPVGLDVRAARSAEQALMARMAEVRDQHGRLVFTSRRSATSGSKKLNDIDRDVRTRIHQGVNDQMRRTLERAGAKVRSKLQASAAGRNWLRDNMISNLTLANGCLADRLPRDVKMAAGLDESQLIESSWDELSTLWDEWLADGDSAILRQIARMTGIDINRMFAQSDALKAAADEGWGFIRGRLTEMATSYLSDAAIDAGEEVVAGSSLVDMGVVRRALAFAGGSGSTDQASAGINVGDDMSVGVMPQLSTGPIVTDTLEGAGLDVAGYTWQHGFTSNPFGPHEDLDGVEFSSWTDEVLANDGDFPDVAFFMPGDHDGCSCDFYVNWANNAADDGSEPSE